VQRKEDREQRGEKRHARRREETFKFCPEEDERERERKAWRNGRGENDMERISETKPRRRRAKEEK